MAALSKLSEDAATLGLVCTSLRQTDGLAARVCVSESDIQDRSSMPESDLGGLLFLGNALRCRLMASGSRRLTTNRGKSPVRIKRGGGG